MRNTPDSCVEPGRTATIEPALRFYRCTALIMAAMLLPAAIEAVLALAPHPVHPDHIAIVMSLALSGAIVTTTALVAALVRADGTSRG